MVEHITYIYLHINQEGEITPPSPLLTFNFGSSGSGSQWLSTENKLEEGGQGNNKPRKTLQLERIKSRLTVFQC